MTRRNEEAYLRHFCLRLLEKRERKKEKKIRNDECHTKVSLTGAAAASTFGSSAVGAGVSETGATSEGWTSSATTTGVSVDDITIIGINGNCTGNQ